MLAKFGEPVFRYLKTHLKGEKKWHKSLFLGKTEGQDSFVVYDGERILLTKSVRRIGQDWGLSLAFYKEFKCPTFDYQTGFGSRIIPTKRVFSLVETDFLNITHVHTYTSQWTH